MKAAVEYATKKPPNLKQNLDFIIHLSKKQPFALKDEIKPLIKS